MANRYVSLAGSDSNDGLTVGTPWLSVSKVNAGTYGANDQILFRGGDTFSGTLALTATNCVGNSQLQPVLIGSYGTGRATISGGSGSGITWVNIGGLTFQNINCSSTIPNQDGTTSPQVRAVIYGNYTATTGRFAGIRIVSCTITGAQCGINITSAASNNCGVNDVEIGNCDISSATEFGGYLQEAAQGLAFSHYAGVWLYNNNIHNIIGDASVSTASANGIVISTADRAVTFTTIGGVAYGNMAEWNRVDTCGSNSFGNQPGGLYGENTSYFVVRHNIINKIVGASGQIANGLNIGADSDFWLVEYNQVLSSGIGVAIDGPTSSAKSFHHTIRYNLLVDNINFGIASSIAGANRATNGSTGQLMDVYSNTIVTDASTFATSIGTIGTGWRVSNNLINGPAWIGIQYKDGQLPTLTGNLYWANSSLGGHLGIYDYDTTTWTTSLTAARALGFEKIGATNTGIVADPLIPFSTSDLASYPTNPRLLPSFLKLAPGLGSPAFGAGINVASTYGISAGIQDWSGRPPSTTIGAISIAAVPVGAPATPVISVVESTTEGPMIAWAAVSGATGYNLYQNGVLSRDLGQLLNPFAIIGSGSWSVTAYNVSGESYQSVPVGALSALAASDVSAVASAILITPANKINNLTGGNVSLAPSGIDFANLTPDLLTSLGIMVLGSTGSTTPASADLQWYVAGFFNSNPYYKAKTAGLFLWYNGSGYTISAALGTNGSAYWTTTIPSVVGPYTANGSASGIPAIAAHGNSASSAFQPEVAFATQPVLSSLVNAISPMSGTVIGSPSPTTTQFKIAGNQAADIFTGQMLVWNANTANATVTRFIQGFDTSTQIITLNSALPFAPSISDTFRTVSFGLTVPSATQIANTMLDLTDAIETGFTPRQAQRMALRYFYAALTNSGRTVRDLANTKDVATGTFDGTGNRTVTIIDKT